MPGFTEQNLLNLIAGGESTTLELKIAPPRPAEVAERLCGLANSLGGFIILGVEDKSLRIVGLNNPADAIDTLLRAARMTQPPVRFEPSEPEIYHLDGKVVVMATIPRTLGPLYQAGGVCWMRRGTHTVPLGVSEIVEILNDRGILKWELLPARKATLKDLDQQKINTYLSNRSERSRQGRRFDNQAELLVGLDCAILPDNQDTTSLKPTNVGLLFFGQNPQFSIPQSEAVCVLYQDEYGVGGYVDRRIITGTIIEIVDGIEAFLRSNIKIGARIEGFKRIDLPEYPIEALREAVINAVVHRDYSREGESIRVFIYQNRIEVHSPGLLMPGITVEQMYRGEVQSRLRNPTLGNLLRDVPGYMERIGSGIRLILRETQDMGLPPPEFKELGEFVVTLYKSPQKPAKSFIPELTPEIKAQAEDTNLTEPDSRQLETSLSKFTLDQSRRLIMVMQYVKEHGAITNHEYRELTKASENTATRDLELLVTRGALKGIGKTRGRRYTLP